VSNAIRIHPQNPKYFEFRGKPLAFITAIEHYGAVMNRPFRYELTGLYSPWVHVAGGPETRLLVPDFSHDLVLRIASPS
jgi:hypothetical protein